MGKKQRGGSRLHWAITQSRLSWGGWERGWVEDRLGQGVAKGGSVAGGGLDRHLDRDKVGEVRA
eukprot:scaffold1440_cov114-Isochrysis_galbana.AAC.12